MLDRADGFVAVRGGIGTLSEITPAWSLLQTRSLNGGTPLVLLGAERQAVLDSLLAHTDLGRRSHRSRASLRRRPMLSPP